MQNYTDEILRLHVKSHIGYHVLADGTAFMQEVATPHTTRISQEVLISAAIDVLRIHGMNSSPKNADELYAACTMNDRTLHRRAHGDQCCLRAIVEARGGHLHHH